MTFTYETFHRHPVVVAWKINKKEVLDTNASIVTTDNDECSTCVFRHVSEECTTNHVGAVRNQ